LPQRHGHAAKARCGGVRRELFPPPRQTWPGAFTTPFVGKCRLNDCRPAPRDRPP
jgi:hypothetical protein